MNTIKIVSRNELNKTNNEKKTNEALYKLTKINQSLLHLPGIQKINRDRKFFQPPQVQPPQQVQPPRVQESPINSKYNLSDLEILDLPSGNPFNYNACLVNDRIFFRTRNV